MSLDQLLCPFRTHNRLFYSTVCKQCNRKETLSLYSVKTWLNRPPGWGSSLGHCIAALAVPPETLGLRPGSVGAGRWVGLCFG